MKKVRISVFALVMALIMTALAACSGAPAATTTAGTTAAGSAEETTTAAPDTGSKTLNLFTWADYLPQETLDQFETDTGIHVNYTYFNSNEEMLTKLTAVKGGSYDVILASDYILDIARKSDLLSKLDKTAMPNFEDIDAAFQSKFYDPDNEFVVPYAAGTPLIVYDPARVDVEITGYESLWNPALKDSLVLMKDMRNLFGMTFKSVGKSLNTADKESIDTAAEKLVELVPNIRKLDYDTPHDAMISGEASVGYMFTPQVAWALSQRPELKVVYPKEGMGLGVDGFVVPVNAPNKANAMIFLNYILDGKRSAELSEFTQYMNCVTTAKEHLSKEYLGNAALYIPSDILGDTEFMQDVGTEATAWMDEGWTKFMNSFN